MREGGVVGEEEGVMPSACSLGNLSNLESCQDTERLCKALPHPPSHVYPRLHMSEREGENQEHSKKQREKQRDRLPMSYVLLF